MVRYPYCVFICNSSGLEWNFYIINTSNIRMACLDINVSNGLYLAILIDDALHRNDIYEVIT